MNLYSHFVLATRLGPIFRPEDQAEYTWGAIVPDIRYLAGLPRSQTHLPKEKIQALCSRYPHLYPFLQGYRVHCVLDEIDLARTVGAAFPIRQISQALHRKFSLQQLAVLVELYYLKTARPSGEISGAANEVLAGMGISSQHTRDYAAAARAYLSAPSYETALPAFHHLGFLEDTRTERYVDAFHTLRRNPLLLNLLLLGVRNAGLEREAARRMQPVLEIERPLFVLAPKKSNG